jgi:hypothetical protein
MVVERIIVLAKTYPELSRKHGPLVCVAGVNEYGEWRRLYPIPFKIWTEEKYKTISFKKWHEIEVDVSERPPEHDRMAESRQVLNWEKIKIIRRINSWKYRLTIVKQILDPNIETIVENGRSLGIIKPVRVNKFFDKPRQRIREEAEKIILEKMEEVDSNLTLLDYVKMEDKYLLPEVKESDVKIDELPWIGYKFQCSNQCKGHEMMVIDWEAQRLFRRYKTINGPVKKKLFHELVFERDLYFVVGNTWRYHKSFMIIGLFYPPKGTTALELLQPVFKQKSKTPTLMEYRN